MSEYALDRFGSQEKVELSTLDRFEFGLAEYACYGSPSGVPYIIELDKQLNEKELALAKPRLEQLACPGCLDELWIKIWSSPASQREYLRCEGCRTEYSSSLDERSGQDNVTTLFPQMYVPDEVKEKGITIDSITEQGIEITGDEIKTLINAAYVGNIGVADGVIQAVIERYSDGRQLEEKVVPKLIALFDKVAQTYVGTLNGSENKQLGPNFLSYVTLARYEAETRAGSYQGAFVLPDQVLALLPNQAVYFEAAMGPGSNLRRIKEINNPSGIIGMDFSSGMVRRAIAEFSKNNSIFLRGDAQSIPVKSNLADVAIMCNAMDRIPRTRAALEQLVRTVKLGGYVVLAQCMPFQNEKIVAGGTELVYVPEDQRFESVEAAADAIELRDQRLFKGLEWNISTIADGNETLSVDVIVGRKWR